jgi:hypothetical protein
MAVSTGKEVRVLEKVGIYPYLMLALPENQAK